MVTLIKNLMISKEIMPRFAQLYLNLAGYTGAIFDSFIFVTIFLIIEHKLLSESYFLPLCSYVMCFIFCVALVCKFII